MSFRATRLGQECVSICLINEWEMFDVAVPTSFALLWRGITCGRAGMIGYVLNARSRSTRRCKQEQKFERTDSLSGFLNAWIRIEKKRILLACRCLARYYSFVLALIGIGIGMDSL